MRFKPCYVAWLLLTVIVAVGCSEQRKAAPRTAAEAYADFDREHQAGHLDTALKLARDLARAYPGTEEADRVAQQIPVIEADIRAAAQAESTRAAQAAAAREAQVLADKWTYQATDDPMTSRQTRYASIQSENTVNFDFPYSGEQHATLLFRDHPTYGRDVLLRIEQGQFLCHSYEDCTIRVRFDESPAQRWSAVGPADNSTTLIFIRDYTRFLRSLRAAKRVRLQVPIYQEGEPVFEFLVSGFDYTRYAGSK